VLFFSFVDVFFALITNISGNEVNRRIEMEKASKMREREKEKERGRESGCKRILHL